MEDHSTVDPIVIHSSCIWCCLGENLQQLRNSEQDQESFTLADDSSGYPEEPRGRNTDGNLWSLKSRYGVKWCKAKMAKSKNQVGVQAKVNKNCYSPTWLFCWALQENLKSLPVCLRMKKYKPLWLWHPGYTVAVTNTTTMFQSTIL